MNLFAQSNAFASCSFSGPGPLPYLPLWQTLPGTTLLRPNVLNFFFLLGRQNTKWIGIGYVVNATNSVPLFPLYRFYAETNVSLPPLTLSIFVNAVNQSQWTNMSLCGWRRAFGAAGLCFNGNWMTNTYQLTPQWANNLDSHKGDQLMQTPRYVRLSRASWVVYVQQYGSRGGGNPDGRDGGPHAATGGSAGFRQVAGALPQSQCNNYLTDQSGHVHLFRQRVTIPNVIPRLINENSADIVIWQVTGCSRAPRPSARAFPLPEASPW